VVARGMGKACVCGAGDIAIAYEEHAFTAGGERIAAGDEITIDYRLNAFGDSAWPCVCGSSNCTGTVVGSFFALPPERQQAYARYAPAFIRREYRRRLRNNPK
jgi:hypothetical protein